MTLGIHAEFIVPLLMLIIMGCSLGVVWWHVGKWFRYPPIPVQTKSLVGTVVWFQFVAMVGSMIILARVIG